MLQAPTQRPLLHYLFIDPSTVCCTVPSTDPSSPASVPFTSPTRLRCCCS